MTARLASDVALNYVSEFLGRGSMFLATALIGGVVGAENFGQFVLIQTLASFAWIAIDSGLGVQGTRDVAAAAVEERETVVDVTVLRVGTATLVLAIVAVVAPTMGGSSPWLAIGFAGSLVFRAGQLDWQIGRASCRERV